MTHPFIPFENVAKLEMVFSQYGQVIENVYHVHNTVGSFGDTEMALLAAHFKGWWVSDLKPDCVNSVSLDMIRVKNLTTETGLGIEYTTGLPILGSSVSAGAPGNVTLSVKWTTGLSGRSFRGRTYHIGLASTLITGDTVGAGFIPNLVTAYGNLIDSMLADWELVVASSYHAGAWRTTGVATPITGVSIEPYVDSQRRRLAGRGR